jgi:hypothetical protein
MLRGNPLFIKGTFRGSPLFIKVKFRDSPLFIDFIEGLFEKKTSYRKDL